MLISFVREDTGMAGIVLPKSVFEVLVKHLVDIEEEKEQLLERYYPDTTKEREAFEDFINNYIKEVEGYISNAKVTKSTKKTCPFVIIGSVVEIEDLHYNEVEKYQIVSPFESNSNSNADFASYLSPMGKALLLKKVKDKVMVETPMGQFTYIIKSIEIPNEMFSIIDEDR
ncbi:MAG: hypothetical protein JG777_2538 [Clostridia bacterium]|jgi:transcription elongation factor GreA|nr:hypothetical protein [Clostridia bacterium]